ncbi:hypothetical protein GOODEAATRI_016542, partial [Goodea atripinnis]
SVELHHPLLQLASLIGSEAEVTDVIGAVVIQVIVSQLGLNGVGAQEGVGLIHEKGEKDFGSFEIVANMMSR